MLKIFRRKKRWTVQQLMSGKYARKNGGWGNIKDAQWFKNRDDAQFVALVLELNGHGWCQVVQDKKGD